MGDEVRIWTTVGSAGTLNQADLAKVSLHQSIIQLGVDIVTNPGNPAAAPAAIIQTDARAVVRYNVTPVDGLFITGPFKYALEIRYRNHVTAKLIEVDLATGAETQLIPTFDSQNFPASPNFQVQSVASKKDSTPMDFVNKAYYVEATLIAPQIVVGRPAEISIIKIIATPDFTDVGQH